MIGAGVSKARAVSVFDSYRGRYRTVRAARFTPNVAELIAAEPGVWLRPKRAGWEVFSRGEWIPATAGDYIAKFGSSPEFTGVLAADYVHEHYSREQQ